MVVLVLPLFDSGICSRTPFFTHKTDQIKRSTTIPYPGLPPKQPCLPPIPKSYEANTLHWPITDRFEMQYSIYAIIHCQLNVVHVPSSIKLGQVLITSATLPFGQAIRHKSQKRSKAGGKPTLPDRTKPCHDICHVANDITFHR